MLRMRWALGLFHLPVLGDTITFSYGENDEERKFGPVVIRLGGPTDVWRPGCEDKDWSSWVEAMFAEFVEADDDALTVEEKLVPV